MLALHIDILGSLHRIKVGLVALVLTKERIKPLDELFV